MAIPLARARAAALALAARRHGPSIAPAAVAFTLANCRPSFPSIARLLSSMPSSSADVDQSRSKAATPAPQYDFLAALESSLIDDLPVQPSSDPVAAATQSNAAKDQTSPIQNDIAADPTTIASASNTQTPSFLTQPSSIPAAVNKISKLADKKSVAEMFETFSSLVSSGLIKQATPLDISNILSSFYTAIGNDNAHIDIPPSILSSAKEAGISLTTEIYAHVIKSLAFIDGATVGDWQHQSANLARERHFIDIFKMEKRDPIIAKLEKNIQAIESRSCFPTLIDIAEAALADGYAFTREMYEDILRACANRGEVELAETWVARMIEAGISISLKIYATMISAYGARDDAFNAQTWFEKYTDSGTAPRPFPFVAFARALASSGRIPAAIDVITRLAPSAQVNFNIIGINDIFRQLYRQLDSEGMIQLYDTLIKDPKLPQPNNLTHSLILSAYISLSRLEDALNIYRLIGAENIPNYLLGILGHLCIIKGKTDTAHEIVRACIKKGGSFDSGLVSKIVESLSSSDETPSRVIALFKEITSPLSAKKALEATEDAISRGPLRPTVKTNALYENILVSVAKASSKSIRDIIDLISYAQKLNMNVRRDVWRQAYMSFRTSPKDALKLLSPNDFFIIIRGAAEMGSDSIHVTREQVREYINSVLKTMIELDIKPTVGITQYIMTSYERAEDTVGIAEWRDTMNQLGHPIGEAYKKPSGENQQSATQQQQRSQSQNFAGPSDRNRGDRHRNMQLFEEITQKIKEHCEKGELDMAIQQQQRLSEINMFMRNPTCLALFRSCLRYGTVSHLMTALKTSLSHIEASKCAEGIRTTMTLATYTSGVMSALNAGNVRVATLVLEEMVKQTGKGVRINVYRSFFDEFSRMPALSTNDVQSIKNLFESMSRENDPVVFPGSAWRCLMMAHDRENNIDALRSTAKAMSDAGYLPDANTISILIRVYARNGLKNEVVELFNKYLDETPNLEIRVFNDIIRMHVQEFGDVDAALRVWKVSTQRQVMPNSDTLRWVLEGLCLIRGDMASAEKLFSVLTGSPAYDSRTATKGTDKSAGASTATPAESTPEPDMAVSSVIVPTVFHYQTLIMGYARTARPHNTERMLALYEEMQRYKCSATVSIYEAIVSALAANGSTVFARTYRDRMMQMGIAPTHFIENALIKAYWARGDVMNARKIFDQMAAADEHLLTQAAQSSSSSPAPGSAAQPQPQPSTRGPSLETYEIMIAGHIAIGQHARANEYIELLRRTNAFPKQHVDDLEGRMFTRPAVVEVGSVSSEAAVDASESGQQPQVDKPVAAHA